MTADVDAIHPLVSVTVTEYAPADRESRFWVVALLFHRNVYPGTPPLIVKFIVPLLIPLQVTSLLALVKDSAGGCETSKESVMVHPRLSLTITL